MVCDIRLNTTSLRDSIIIIIKPLASRPIRHPHCHVLQLRNQPIYYFMSHFTSMHNYIIKYRIVLSFDVWQHLWNVFLAFASNDSCKRRCQVSWRGTFLPYSAPRTASHHSQTPLFSAYNDHREHKYVINYLLLHNFTMILHPIWFQHLRGRSC